MTASGRTVERRPTICLSMIVCDEAHVVRETLDSVAPHIDCWVIVDTGSTDATIETIRSHMAAKGVPGEIHERPWRDFGSNRTEALRLCHGKADYSWVIDADDLVVGDFDLSELRADSYLLRYGDEFRYWRKQIFRDGLRWRYEGVVHEYPVCLDPATEERLEGDYYVDSRRLGARSHAAETYEHDYLLLREALERDPGDARSVFYLAQSYYDAGDYAQALEWYTRRTEMGGWGEEIYYSLLRRAACLMGLGEPTERALAAYLEAWQARPTRAEPLYEIARHYRSTRRFNLGYHFAKRAAAIPLPQEDSLFIAADVYGWRAADELAICAYHSGRPEECFELSTALLEGSSLPESERVRVEANRGSCVPWFAERRREYPTGLVARITERVASESTADAEVTLTITSCGRRGLFERTVNSFLRCCTDVERIGRWICVDNGSAEVDRARLRRLYPCFEFIYTDPASAGHADSMNRLLEAVVSPFWLHLEDDWQFFSRGAYVERAIAILRDDAAIAQVAFNSNYGETLECRRIVGGEVRRTGAEGLRYRLHEEIEPDTPEWEQHLEALPAGTLTVAYWPRLTLRPSVMRTDAIKSLGRFDARAGHYELEFARRYAAAGLKTAFFDAINCLHTGRLTGHGPDGGRVSAYELVADGEHPARPRPIEAPSVIDERLGIWVVNLDRRPDRWNSFRAAVSAAAGVGFVERCRRFAAIDGTKLSQTSEIRRLFRGNDFAFRRGVVGCALSHISIWRSLAKRGGREVELVLEDDVRPLDRFDRQLAAVLHELRDVHTDFDLAFLGYSPTETASEAETAGVPRLRPMRWERYLGGGWAYLLSGRGAQKLVELVDRDGVQSGIDRFLMLKGAELRVLECDPPLIGSPLALAGVGVDSDIQHDFEPLADGPPRRASRERRQIAIYAGPGWERWHPIEIATRGLGGSETAAYRLAESLSELGYEVTLYGECESGMVRNVMVRDWRTFDPTEPRLAVISSRRPEAFDGHVAAERKLLWLHDVDAGDELTPARASRIDRILCLSSWHHAHLAELYPFAKEKLVRIRNGITPSYFTSEPAPEREKRVLYTSSPDRGLDILLKLWPLVREQVPDAEFVHTYAPVYDRIADHDPTVRAHRQKIRKLADQPRVRSLSGLAQPKLAELMRSSLVWAHPSFSTRYGTRMMETSCIGAMEAQAAGCCVVAASWGALSETVQVGRLIEGDPAQGPFRERFTDAIVVGLTDERIQARAQTEGPEIASGWGWDGVAEMVSALVDPALVSR